jgi:hypothetical protein
MMMTVNYISAAGLLGVVIAVYCMQLAAEP